MITTKTTGHSTPATRCAPRAPAAEQRANEERFADAVVSERPELRASVEQAILAMVDTIHPDATAGGLTLAAEESLKSIVGYRAHAGAVRQAAVVKPRGADTIGDTEGEPRATAVTWETRGEHR